jgi:methyl-accepting chemotaxis protein
VSFLESCKLSWLVKNTTIKKRIWFGFGLILVVLAGVSLSTLGQFTSLSNGINKLTDKIQPAVLSSQNLAFQLESSNYALGFYILTKEEQYKESYFGLLDEAQATLEELQAHEYIASNDKYRTDVESIANNISTLFGFKDRIVELVNNEGLNLPAMALAGAQLNPASQRMQGMLSQMLLSEWEEDNTDESRSELRQVFYDLRYFTAQLMGEIRTFLAFRAEINITNMQSIVEVIDSKLASAKESSDMFSFEQEEIIPEYEKTLAEWKKAVEETIQVHQSDEYRKDIYLAKTSIGPVIASTQNELLALVKKLTEDISSESSVLQGESDRAGGLVLMGMSLGIFVGLIIAFFMSRMITVPINEVVNAFNDLAEGEGDLTRRLNAEGKSEMARLSDGFNRFADKVHHLVEQVGGEVQNLSGVVQNVSKIVDQTQQGSLQQREQTGQVATAITQMTATVQEVASNANSAAESAQQADQNARTGQSVVSDTINSIKALASEIETGANVIHELEKDAEAIGSVLDVIRGIAEQTNLLALNAAIEAARAGEQGRGFAVVADEVRTLASRTQESTTEIQEMINSLQAQARAAVKAITQGQDKTRTSVDNASNAGEALNAIADSVTTITDMNIQIASASEQQSTVAEEINMNVVNISEVADENASASEQLANSSKDLARLTEDLRGLVSQFKY